MNNFPINNFNNINFNQNFQLQNLNSDKQPETVLQNPLQQTQNPQQTQTAPQINPLFLENLQMENEEIVKYLQSVLKMPSEIEEFVKQMLLKDVKGSFMDKFLEALLDIKNINEFLKNNSKDAIDKILQTISILLKQGAGDTKQLKEILSVLSAINHNSNVETNTLRELLLLYIPINYSVFDKQMELKEIVENQDAIIKNSTLSIMFETVNFSNILCTLTCENNDILIEIFANKIFPYQNFEEIIHMMSSVMNLNMGIDYVQINAKNKSESQNIKIISSEFIPSNALIIAHLIVETIFKLDDNF